MPTHQPEEPAEEGRDWEYLCTVTVTELGLKQQQNSNSRALGRQGVGENQQHELKECRIISLCPCCSVDPCLQSLAHPGCLQAAELIALNLDAEIPHINTGWLLC